MRQRSGAPKEPPEKVLKDIRRETRKRHSPEEKIRFVPSGEESIAELCRREGIAQSVYYSWSKEFLEASKKRLAGDTAREATSEEVKALRKEAGALEQVVAKLTLSPAFIVVKAAEEFRDQTTAPNQLWQTDFTYLKVIGWG